MSLGNRRGISLTLSAAALAWQGACTFPDFVVPRKDGATGGSGQGGISGEGGEQSGGKSPTAGTPSGGTPAGGQDGEAGTGGEPAVVDSGPCGQRRFALHCYDEVQNDDETDVDCGGTRCPSCAAEESCTVDDDCSSVSCVDGTCERTFELSYRQLTPDLETPTFRFSTQLKALGSQPVLLRDVGIRYYFSRNGVAEPIVATGTAVILGGADVTSDTTWNVVRQIRGDGIVNDAYVEIGFTGGRILAPGQLMEIASEVGASTSEPFNQMTHHSFDMQTEQHESRKLSVYHAGKRVWGRGPEVDNPPSCLVQGVNLNGAEVTIDGENWLPSPASLQGSYVDTKVVLRPRTDSAREEMIRAGFYFDDDQFSFAVANGDYALVVYAWSANGAETGVLRVQGEDRDVFRCRSFGGGSPWAPLGPYRIAVSDGQLILSATGVLRIGGFELRKLDE